MYNTYHLINKEPFLNKPSPSVFFDSSTHTRAWDFLKANIESEEPAVMVTGNYGVGKTVLCLKLVEELKQSGYSYVYVSTPMQSYQEVLWGICAALGIDDGVSQDSEEEDLHRVIYKHVDANPDTRLVIIVDDVQEHNSKTLNKIRLLANYTREGNYAIRLFLFGSPAFVQRLKALDMEPLDQRIKRRFEVQGLDFADTKEYIYFRLIHAGAKGSPFFMDDAIRLIVSATGGILRKTNNLCDMCLQIGASRGIEDIDRALVEEALQALGWEAEPGKVDRTEETSVKETTAEAPVAELATANTAATAAPVSEVTAAVPPAPVLNEPEKPAVEAGLKLHSDGDTLAPQLQNATMQPVPFPGQQAGFQAPDPAHQPMHAPHSTPHSAPQHTAATGHFGVPQSSQGAAPYFGANAPAGQPNAQQGNMHSDDHDEKPIKPAGNDSKWTAWLFRGLVVFLLLAILAAVVMRDGNVAG